MPRMVASKREESLGLRELLSALQRRLPVILAAVLLTAGLVALISVRQPDVYTASSAVLFRSSPLDDSLLPGGVGQSDPTRAGTTNLDLVSLSGIAAGTSVRLDGRLSAAQVTSGVEFASEPQSDLVRISAEGEDPRLAVALVNAYAAEIVDFRVDAANRQIADLERRIQQEIDRLRPTDALPGVTERIEQLQASLTGLRGSRILQTGDAEVLERAALPLEPSGPARSRNVLLGAFGGLLLGLILALVLEQLDRRLRRTDDIVETAGLPVLGSVPQSRALAADPTGELPPFESESFRMIDAGLNMAATSSNASMLLTSAEPGEGKTTIALQLAKASAEAGSTVLLIDADLRRGSLTRALDLADEPGLGSLLRGESTEIADVWRRPPDTAAQNGRSTASKLWIVPAGELSAHPTELLGSAHMNAALRAAEAQFDLVILDCSPIGVVADAIPLLAMVRDVVLIARLGVTTRDSLEDLLEQVQRLKVPVRGMIVNGAPRQREGAYAAYAPAQPKVEA